ncbi:hypothetical protein H6G76_08720 [Nostoc sp. FACHB-152]|uniref:hypothetical protein n=1 Tax=unclassified Nostoc TaxID=2593658 RepID=UPI00168743F8|nr:MULTISPECIES: hypothetical protein [unclassified Nostoc]MBD2447247.1 hypothetical protein [Nostoc sp. FACHB-152]MBD2468152.1 hypothetical protein [Nostoc sp. FACHB-145]
MSISYFLIKVTPNVNSMDDINENNILEIASKAKVIDIISEIYPTVSFYECYYYLPGCCEDDNNSRWKVHFEEDKPIKFISVSPHIGICDLKVIENLCELLKCRIFDPQNSRFIY